MKPVILASQSPRRKQLLEWAEVPFKVIVKHSEETFPANMLVSDVPVHIARNKALAVKESLSSTNKIIVAADTVVVLDHTIIGKPKDKADAIDILTRLSGRQHEVITGVVILYDDKELPILFL